MPKAGALLAQYGFETPPIVITNAKIQKLHGSVLMKSLERELGLPHVIRIGDGERYKNHDTLLQIYAAMFRLNANRRSWILAFGGGVIGDIAGFAAATFMRGIRFAMVPTTLLAQVDSSIGGKVGINVSQGKNLIGAFHQPSAVISDMQVLRTLPKRELSSGVYEVIKCGAIRSERLLQYLESRLAGVRKCLSAEMEHIVMESARIKADVVASDETESGLRMILNYGHTIGHAFEAATGYKRFKHGEAVAWGMIAALGYGRELGLLGSDASSRLARLIRGVDRLPSLKGIAFTELWSALFRDKKFLSGDIRMVFLRRLGKAEIVTGIDPESIRGFLKRFLAANGELF